MFIGGIRGPRPRFGTNRYAVRGTVVGLTPERTKTFLRIFKEKFPPEIHVQLDEEPYRLLCEKKLPRPLQTFRIGWNRPDPLPVPPGQRVLVRFRWADRVEYYFGCESLSYDGIQLIDNEMKVFPDEIFESQMNLPLAMAL